MPPSVPKGIRIKKKKKEEEEEEEEESAKAAVKSLISICLKTCISLFIIVNYQAAPQF